jgi:hypothetical protein
MVKRSCAVPIAWLYCQVSVFESVCSIFLFCLADSLVSQVRAFHLRRMEQPRSLEHRFENSRDRSCSSDGAGNWPYQHLGY